MTAASSARPQPRAPRARARSGCSRKTQVREATVRRQLDTPGAGLVAVLPRLRTLVETYQDLAPLPTSPIADDALWQGARLAADAFWQAGEAQDRDSARRMFRALATSFPQARSRGRCPPRRVGSTTRACPRRRPRRRPLPRRLGPSHPRRRCASSPPTPAPSRVAAPVNTPPPAAPASAVAASSPTRASTPAAIPAAPRDRLPRRGRRARHPWR